jgi:hypothetical protein
MTTKKIDYSISALPSRKDLIKQPLISQNGILPYLTQSAYFIGSSGSGKSNLVSTLLSDPRFYGTKPHAYDRIVWISPTCLNDDIQKCLTRDFPHVPLSEEDCISDMSQVDSFLTQLKEDQSALIVKNGGNHKAPVVLVVMDDCAVEKDVLNLKSVRTLFIGGRHSNCCIWMLSQSYNLLPRALRLQANWLFVFTPSRNELDTICEEVASSLINKKQMSKLVSYCTAEKFEFMTFSRLAEPAQRYRKGLSDVVDLSSL